VLQLDFPDYRISIQTIWDKLFYLAEAREPGIQPRFVQAETAGRLRQKLHAERPAPHQPPLKQALDRSGGD
jgi:hypothetical protein